MTPEDFGGFTVNIMLDDEGDWLAHFVELPNISAFAESPSEAVRELKEAWEAVKESYRESGQAVPVAPVNREYTGRFSLRIDKRVHRALAVEAAQAGISLNALVAQKLAKDVSVKR